MTNTWNTPITRESLAAKARERIYRRTGARIVQRVPLHVPLSKTLYKHTGWYKACHASIEEAYLVEVDDKIRNYVVTYLEIVTPHGRGAVWRTPHLRVPGRGTYLVAVRTTSSALSGAGEFGDDYLRAHGVANSSIVKCGDDELFAALCGGTR